MSSCAGLCGADEEPTCADSVTDSGNLAHSIPISDMDEEEHADFRTSTGIPVKARSDTNVAEDRCARVRNDATNPTITKSSIDEDDLLQASPDAEIVDDIRGKILNIKEGPRCKRSNIDIDLSEHAKNLRSSTGPRQILSNAGVLKPKRASAKGEIGDPTAAEPRGDIGGPICSISMTEGAEPGQVILRTDSNDSSSKRSNAGLGRSRARISCGGDI